APLATAYQAILEQAEHATATLVVDKLRTIDTELVADVTITSLVGHKFPSGVGFRRAFINPGRLSSISFRTGVAWQVSRRDTGFVRGGALLARHSPREPQPLPTVKPDDSLSMSAPGSVRYCVGAGVGVGAPRPLAKTQERNGWKRSMGAPT